LSAAEAARRLAQHGPNAVVATPHRRIALKIAKRFAEPLVAILLAAAFSFLGMGAQPPSSDWGLMISDARPFLETAPWIVLAPGIAMSVTVIGINLLGDGLRQVMDPRLSSGRSG